MPGQRSKNGCWTCRLRRKKCNEGGPPCNNCEARDIFCHGYGPKPSWKDRGDREKEEAGRLQLHTRRRRSTTSPGHVSEPTGSVSSTSASSTAVEAVTPPAATFGSPVFSPIPSDFSFSLSSPAQDAAHYGILEVLGLTLPESASMATFSDGMWPTDTTETLAELAQVRPSIPALPDPPQLEASQTPAISFASTDIGPDQPKTHHVIPSETDIDLIMRFIGNASPDNGWILFLLLRSPTFYHASLSMSAYRLSLSLPADSEGRTGAVQEYQTHRARAIQGFCDMQAMSLSSFSGEGLICAVQIALLEALGKNMQSCHSYLASASQLFVEDTNPQSQHTIPSPAPPSPLELKALNTSRALLIWNDILTSSAQKRLPAAAPTYRAVLTTPSFTTPFLHATSHPPWLPLALLDTTSLEVWKHTQESRAHLSIPTLVSRAAALEKSVRDHLAGGSSSVGVGTQIFAAALLTHLHTIVSGARTGVPEIREGIERVISVWGKREGEVRALAWPYCVCASLATGAQRDVFRLGSGGEGMLDFVAVVEECWREVDKGGVAEWRGVLGRGGVWGLFS